MAHAFALLKVRPSELMCMVCRMGRFGTEDLRDTRLNALLEELKKHPRRPVDLVFYDQTGPGVEDILSSRRAQYEILKDGEIYDRIEKQFLYSCNRTPGAFLTALWVLASTIQSSDEICRLSRSRWKDWPECPDAEKAYYRKGRVSIMELVKKPSPGLLPKRRPALPRQGEIRGGSGPGAATAHLPVSPSVPDRDLRRPDGPAGTFPGHG